MFRRLRAWLHRKDKDYCNGCGRKLKQYEKFWYGTRCEKCEERINKEIMRAIF